MMLLPLLCFWSLMVTRTMTFKPTIGHGDDPSMYTHESITIEGVDRAAAKFLASLGILTTSTSHPEEIIKSYLRSNTHSYEDYTQRRHEFAAAVLKAYSTHHMDPDYTVNSERIREADSLVKSIRLDIASLLSTGTLDDASTKLLIDKVGKCLMIIQSFYSNTNWIEMMVNGGESFLTFGTLNPFNMTVATSGTVTCRNCNGDIPHSCKYNLLVHDRLTSGYLYGQSYYPKPAVDRHSTEGKCSHGGVSDLGRNTSATGGINKETPDWKFSPHAHLHNISGTTAVMATEAFFMDERFGFLRSYDRGFVQTIFKLNKPSMAFVVEVSRSMSSDIRSIKDSILARLSAVQGTINEPSEYVLATFTDQANETTVVSTTDGHELLHWIDTLSLVRETACRCYVMSGILAAMKVSGPNSVIYVATDGDAKDENMTSIVIQEMNAKHINLHYILTGSCDLQRRATGLFKSVDQTTTMNVLNLRTANHRGLSLGYVIDVSGPMADDINSVKNSFISYLSATIGTVNEPNKYILSTFSDQANSTTIATTSDGQELIRWIDALNLVNNTECRRYVMSAIRAAINASDPYSTIYVATDGEAKDESMLSTVIQEANAKHIHLQFLMTGSCPDSGRHQRATGSFKSVDQTTTKNVLNLRTANHRGLSLGYVIDVSGPMADDINSVKNSFISSLSATIGTVNEPNKYILSTFSDQANSTTIATTTDGQELIRWIDALNLVNNTECRRYVMSAIRAAINASDPYSTIYVATDGEAKDESMLSTVIQEANAKHIHLQFLMTGSCPDSGRHQRDMVERQKISHSAFDDLVASTRGNLQPNTP